MKTTNMTHDTLPQLMAARECYGGVLSDQISRVFAAVEQATGIADADYLVYDRHLPQCMARNMAAYGLRHWCELDLMSIGTLLGRRHPSVVNMLRSFRDDRQSNRRYRLQCEAFDALMQQAPKAAE